MAAEYSQRKGSLQHEKTAVPAAVLLFADRHSGPEHHSYDPFWPGISEVEELDPEPGPFVVDGKTYTYYQATQKQRAMERQIWALKREVNAEGDKAVLGSLIRQKTREYRAFSDAVNIRPKLERLRVLSYDRETAGSVAKAMISREASLSAIASGSYKNSFADSKAPKVLKMPDEALKRTTNVNFKGMHAVVPEGEMLSSVRVIAGSGTSTAIDDIQRLATKYNDYGGAFGWQKKVGTAHTKHFSYEIHWYENAGGVPIEEVKTVRVKKK